MKENAELESKSLNEEIQALRKELSKQNQKHCDLEASFGIVQNEKAKLQESTARVEALSAETAADFRIKLASRDAEISDLQAKVKRNGIQLPAYMHIVKKMDEQRGKIEEDAKRIEDLERDLELLNRSARLLGRVDGDGAPIFPLVRRGAGDERGKGPGPEPWSEPCQPPSASELLQQQMLQKAMLRRIQRLKDERDTGALEIRALRKTVKDKETQAEEDGRRIAKLSKENARLDKSINELEKIASRSENEAERFKYQLEWRIKYAHDLERELREARATIETRDAEARKRAQEIGYLWDRIDALRGRAGIHNGGTVDADRARVLSSSSSSSGETASDTSSDSAESEPRTTALAIVRGEASAGAVTPAALSSQRAAAAPKAKKVWTEEELSQLCFSHQKGACKKGKSCAWRHETAPWRLWERVRTLRLKRIAAAKDAKGSVQGKKK